MKISYKWLNEYLDASLSVEEMAELLTDIGLEVEGIEQWERVKGGLEGVVVGRVVECGRHPNAERLSLTKVDIGTGELLSIVCGAPNVAAGQKVLVATAGTTLYPVEGEPIKLKRARIRGEVSEGMICAEDELGLGTDHSGIVVLPEDAPVGMPAAEYLELAGDTVFEIGLTPNRSDATSHLGVARDLAAALRVRKGQDVSVRLPDVSAFRPDSQDRPVQVIVEEPAGCPRYSGLTITGVRVGESPQWLKDRLEAIGLRPINNVVDVTNFVLHELGQPLHAFDLDKVAGDTIRVKTLPEGTPFVTLDEVERKLSAEDLMICDGESNPLCIAGVFGGLGSGVTEQTSSVFLESACFNPRWIRRTSRRHQLFTDAAKIFEKGADPNVTVFALKRAALLIRELAGGTIASEVVDVYPEPIAPRRVSVAWAWVSRLIGVELSRKTIERILAALEMPIVEADDQHFTVEVPTNKHDVQRPADVVEEILRIYGFNEVPVSDRMQISLSYEAWPNDATLRQAVSELLAANGFYEMMGLSLSQSRYYQELMPVPEQQLVYIQNTSNAQLDVMRPTMLFSALEAVQHNLNRQRSDLRLFEFGKSYRRTENGFAEPRHLTLTLTGKRWPESWRFHERADADFFTLKAMVQLVFDRLGVQGFQRRPLEADGWSYGLEYHRGPRVLARLGRVSGHILKGMDIDQPVFFAELAWDELTAIARRNKIKFEALDRFPAVRRDLALVIDNSVKFEDIAALARKTARKLLRDLNLFDVYENEARLGKGKKSYAVSFLFQHPDKTLQSKEVDKVMEQLIQAFEQKLGATIRR